MWIQIVLLLHRETSTTPLLNASMVSLFIAKGISSVQTCTCSHHHKRSDYLTKQSRSLAGTGGRTCYWRESAFPVRKPALGFVASTPTLDCEGGAHTANTHELCSTRLQEELQRQSGSASTAGGVAGIAVQESKALTAPPLKKWLLQVFCSNAGRASQWNQQRVQLHTLNNGACFQN